MCVQKLFFIPCHYILSNEQNSRSSFVYSVCHESVQMNASRIWNDRAAASKFLYYKVWSFLPFYLPLSASLPPPLGFYFILLYCVVRMRIRHILLGFIANIISLATHINKNNNNSNSSSSSEEPFIPTKSNVIAYKETILELKCLPFFAIILLNSLLPFQLCGKLSKFSLFRSAPRFSFRIAFRLEKQQQL